MPSSRGIFPTRASNSHLLHRQAHSLLVCHQGTPRTNSILLLRPWWAVKSRMRDTSMSLGIKRAHPLLSVLIFPGQTFSSPPPHKRVQIDPVFLLLFVCLSSWLMWWEAPSILHFWFQAPNTGTPNIFRLHTPLGNFSLWLCGFKQHARILLFIKDKTPFTCQSFHSVNTYEEPTAPSQWRAAQNRPAWFFLSETQGMGDQCENKS